MDLRRKLAIIGVALLLIGMMVPLFEQDDVLRTYSNTGRLGFAFLLFMLLIASGMLLTSQLEEAIWVIGLIALGFLINDFRIVQRIVSDAERAHLSWGWLVLFNGAAFLCLTLFLGEDRERLAHVLDNLGAVIASLDPNAPFLEDEEEEESEDSEEENGDVNGSPEDDPAGL